MNKEFRLAPGESTKVVDERTGKYIQVANFCDGQGRWFIIQEEKGNYMIAAVNRPDPVQESTLEESEPFRNNDVM